MDSEQVWPCGNCGASQEFGSDGCNEHTPVKLVLELHCGSDRLGIRVKCPCSWGMYRSPVDGAFRCTNCRRSVEGDYIRNLVDTYSKELAIFGQEVSSEKR